MMIKNTLGEVMISFHDHIRCVLLLLKIKIKRLTEEISHHIILLHTIHIGIL